MNTTFFFQLLVSFFIGGTFIGLLSLLAERCSRETAGIIISLPSTFAIALIFLALTQSPDVIPTIVPVVPLSLGASYVFMVVYVYLANIVSSVRPSVVFSLLGATVTWFVLAVPLVLLDIINVWWSLLGYVLLTGVSHYFLAVRPKLNTQPVTAPFTGKQVLMRSLIAGAMIAAVVFLAKVLGPLWGGLFSAYPAATSASLIIVHVYQSPRFLFHVMRSVCANSVGFIIYIFVAAWSFPRYGITIGTILSYGSSLVYAYGLNHWLRR